MILHTYKYLQERNTGNDDLSKATVSLERLLVRGGTPSVNLWATKYLLLIRYSTPVDKTWLLHVITQYSHATLV